LEAAAHQTRGGGPGQTGTEPDDGHGVDVAEVVGPEKLFPEKESMV
jgi:hypothetical protein